MQITLDPDVLHMQSSNLWTAKDLSVYVHRTALPTQTISFQNNNMDTWQGWNKINHSIISWLCYTPNAFQKLERGGVAMAMHYSIAGIHGWPVSFIDLFALVVRWSPPKSWSRLWYSGNGWWSPDSFCIKEKIQPIHQSEKDIGS